MYYCACVLVVDGRVACLVVVQTTGGGGGKGQRVLAGVPFLTLVWGVSIHWGHQKKFARAPTSPRAWK